MTCALNSFTTSSAVSAKPLFGKSAAKCFAGYGIRHNLSGAVSAAARRFVTPDDPKKIPRLTLPAAGVIV